MTSDFRPVFSSLTIFIPELNQNPEQLTRDNIDKMLEVAGLKKKPLRFEDLEEFVACFNPENRHKRKQTWSEKKKPEGRWRKYTYKEIIARDKTSLDIFWLKDKSLTDLDNLPEPDILAQEIIENLEAGLNSFREILGTLEEKNP